MWLCCYYTEEGLWVSCIHLWLGSEGPHCLSLRSCGYETIPFSISSPFRSLCFSRVHASLRPSDLTLFFTLAVILFPCKSNVLVMEWKFSSFILVAHSCERIKEMVWWDYLGDGRVTHSVSISIRSALSKLKQVSTY